MAKLTTVCTFLKASDNTAKIMSQIQILLGFASCPPELVHIYQPCFLDARCSRQPLMEGDFEGVVQRKELEHGFSLGHMIRWEYNTEANARLWAMRHVLPHAIYIQFGCGLSEYDWKRTKAYEVFFILYDPLNLLFMGMLRVDDLLCFGSAFKAGQLTCNASAHLSGPESLWRTYRCRYQQLLRYVRFPMPSKQRGGARMCEGNFRRILLVAPNWKAPVMEALWREAELPRASKQLCDQAHAITLLVRHVQERLAAIDHYFPDQFSSHELVNAMMHEEPHKSMVGVLVPSQRALHASRELVRRTSGRPHWSQVQKGTVVSEDKASRR